MRLLRGILSKLYARFDRRRPPPTWVGTATIEIYEGPTRWSGGVSFTITEAEREEP